MNRNLGSTGATPEADGKRLNAALSSRSRAAAARRGESGLWVVCWLSEALGRLVARPCPLCRRLPVAGAARRSGGSRAGLCDSCTLQLDLPKRGLSGQAPLAWWSSGAYGGRLRQILLNQRRRPEPAVLRALLEPLAGSLEDVLAERARAQTRRTPLLVPVPSWKRRPNPLPGLIATALARELGLRRIDLLRRSHPVLGQHRLGRRLRQENQRGSFQLDPVHTWRQPAPLLIVDDILTTGATLRHAALCLEQAGWPVLGAACLARTPSRRDWLRTP